MDTKDEIGDILRKFKANGEISNDELEKCISMYDTLKYDLEECGLRKKLISDKLKKFQEICTKYDVYSSQQLENLIVRLHDDNETLTLLNNYTLQNYEEAVNGFFLEFESLLSDEVKRNAQSELGIIFRQEY